ncbi:hypothetical protein Q31b_27510 [Novipirellula aureliae]|uniref:Metal-binding protein n=1 Tax=Novipirellula aureliae TaxID=2527966 RepID=A0A5C6DXF6_9BACT|nr:YecH family metal-binding protein [Novipirellula aureliae]TWU41312.1 hypothetical protein Q31b_27510 [Novipirellula aureliae]
MSDSARPLEVVANESVHGHDIMQMMVESGKRYTKESLRAEIVEKFGEQTRYHTCSKQDMTADELIAFLDTKGKFNETSEGFTTAPENICEH